MLNLDLILLSLSAMALASPTGSLVERQNPPPPAENQFPWSVEVCTDKEMGGHCSKPMISSNYVLTSSGCLSLPDNDTKLQDSISSLEVGSSSTCDFFMDNNCYGDILRYSDIAIIDLKNAGYNDKISSIRCTKK